jgi:quinoprotein glucose dehydrogenase
MTKVLILCLLTGLFACTSVEQHIDWPEYQGGPHRNQWSDLDQISRANVSGLKIAWEYHTQDRDTKSKSDIQCNPIVVDGVLYASSPTLRIFALDAATGDEIWSFDPSVIPNFSRNHNRGVTYWVNPEDSQDRRILFTSGPNLICLNAADGRLVAGFGTNGVTSLKQGLEIRASELHVSSTSPGVVFGNLYITGTRVSEFENAAPGHIQAFDILNGNLIWLFKTIPEPGEHGHETWPDTAYLSVGGANSWAGMSIDRKRGVVYVPTGSAAFDFWGGDRVGSNLFANCIIALRAETGERLWHYQTVHHDIWDRDLPAPPNLLTINHEGQPRDVVAQISKSGFIFVLDRDTGVPVFPIIETSFPPSDLDGEMAWPTQPVPSKPPAFVRQVLSENDIHSTDPATYDSLVSALGQMRAGGQFIPASLEGTVLFPGFSGGGEWGGASVNPETGIMYVNANEWPSILKVEPIQQKKQEHTVNNIGKIIYQLNCAVCHGDNRQEQPTSTYPSLENLNKRLTQYEIINLINNGKGLMPSFRYLDTLKKEALVAYLLNTPDRLADQGMVDLMSLKNSAPYKFLGYKEFNDKNGYPAVKPPWGSLNAVDLNKGEILWKVPLGETLELQAKGFTKTGTRNYGGPVATSGGLIFIAATTDECIRAFDQETGEELWKYKLPAGGFATPSVYFVEDKQYVVIACGGNKFGSPLGDSYVAFSL